MELPALVSPELTQYSRASDDMALLLNLRNSIPHLSQFVLFACEDETWADHHHVFMSKAIEVLTRRLFHQKIHPEEACTLAFAIQKHWRVLQDLVCKDLTIEFERETFSLNSLLFCAQSAYLRHLVISQCSDKKIKRFKLIDPPFDRDFFHAYVVFSEQGDLPNLWHHSEEELITFMKMAVDIDCKPLELLSAETYKRYLDWRNVFTIADKAYQLRWKCLYHQCADFVNGSESYIRFLTDKPGFAICLESLGDQTLEQFSFIQNSVTYLQCTGNLAESSLFPELIEKCNSLRTLDVSEATQGDEILKALNYRFEGLIMKLSEWLDSENLEKIISLCPYLTMLDLSNNTQLNYRFWGVLSRLKDLQSLTVSGCYQIIETDLKVILQACVNLSELRVADCKKLPEISFQMIGRFLRKLRFLDVSRCSISDKALIEIASRCTGIDTLILEGCSYITDKGLREVFRLLPNLVEIDIEGCSVTQEIKKVLLSICPKINFRTH